jgi:hypothetical protein
LVQVAQVAHPRRTTKVQSVTIPCYQQSLLQAVVVVALAARAIHHYQAVQAAAVVSTIKTAQLEIQAVIHRWKDMREVIHQHRHIKAQAAVAQGQWDQMRPDSKPAAQVVQAFPILIQEHRQPMQAAVAVVVKLAMAAQAVQAAVVGVEILMKVQALQEQQIPVAVVAVEQMTRQPGHQVDQEL